MRVLLTTAIAFMSVIAIAQQAGSVDQARALLQQGKVNEALAILNGLQMTAPNTPGLAHEIGVAEYRKGDFAEAMRNLKHAVDEKPDDKEATQLLGLSYYFSGHPKDAIPYLEKVQSWLPQANVDASYVLGLCYMQASDYNHARSAFATMYGVPVDSAAAHLFLARMLLRQEFVPVAEQEAQTAAKLDPRLPGAHFLLGELYVFKSQVPDAIEEFKRELTINPLNAQAYYKLADAYSRTMKYDDAERLLQRSIWLDSTATGPYVLMAKVLLKKGDSDLAQRAAERAISMDPNNYVAHFLLGQSLQAQGKAADADRELKRSQELQAAQTHSNPELQSK